MEARKSPGLFSRIPIPRESLMLQTLFGAFGAVALLATCIAAEHVRARLLASGLYPQGRFIAD
ncbi:hypothetical protein [Dankookia sp. P2]|uniref:hypothetical protein n=1 Tax=Dankookia sp. P2 TaxID=3423955 RepID=UPI003D66953B